MNTQEEQRLQTFVNGTPLDVDPRSIDRELTALWAAARTGVEPSKAVVRFSILNLIVMARNSQQLEPLTSQIIDLTMKHPCRAILLVNEGGEGASTVKATVAAHCRLPVGGGMPVCGEQINITASGGDAAAILPGTVIPLLTSDLPVALGWPDWPSGALAADGWSLDPALFTPLLQSADHLIVDSMRFGKPNSNLVRLEALHEQDYPSIAITDLNWLRLLTWRQLTAQVFDSPSLRSYLPNLSKITVRYVVQDDRPLNPCQALLYLGWLSDKMSWRPSEISPQESGNSAITLRSSTGSQLYAWVLTTAADNIWAGDIAEVVMEGSYNGVAATFTLERIAFDEQPQADGSKPPAEHIRTIIEVQGQNRIERVVPLGKQAWAQLVGNALGNLGHDSAFEQALQMAVWMSSTTGTKKVDKGVRGGR